MTHAHKTELIKRMEEIGTLMSEAHSEMREDLKRQREAVFAFLDSCGSSAQTDLSKATELTDQLVANVEASSRLATLQTKVLLLFVDILKRERFSDGTAEIFSVN